MTPLALTDDQLNLCTCAAAMIPVQDRCRFLQSIANRLGDLAHPSDDAVREALDFVLNARGIVGGVKAFSTRSSNQTRKDKANALFR